MTSETMTESAAPARSRRRPVGPLGAALAKPIARLQAGYLRARPDPATRADLARLRRGLGKEAGSVPEIWDLTIGVVPESLVWDGDEPGRAEQAAHAALTLYALHQQSMRAPAHVPGVSFGYAVAQLAAAPDVSHDAVVRRFMAAATAISIDEVLTHVRGLITQLRAHRQGLDYARFADDVRELLTPGGAQRVRLAWGRDLYRATPDTDPPAETNDDNGGATP